MNIVINIAWYGKKYCDTQPYTTVINILMLDPNHSLPLFFHSFFMISMRLNSDQSPHFFTTYLSTMCWRLSNKFGLKANLQVPFIICVFVPCKCKCLVFYYFCSSCKNQLEWIDNYKYQPITVSHCFPANMFCIAVTELNYSLQNVGYCCKLKT